MASIKQFEMDNILNTNAQGLLREITGKRVGRANTKEIRADYQRLQSIARKRLERAQARGYQKNYEKFTPVSQIKSPDELAKEYARVSRYLVSQESTAEGRKQEARKRVETFNELGYKFVTYSNEKSFGEFMGRMIELYTEETPDGKRLMADSDKIVQAYDYIREALSENGKEADFVNESADVLRKLFDDWVEAQT